MDSPRLMALAALITLGAAALIWNSASQRKPPPELKLRSVPSAAKAGAARPRPPGSAPTIRVALADQPVREAKLRIDGPFTVRSLDHAQTLLESGALQECRVTLDRGGFRLGGHTIASRRIEIVPGSSPGVWVAGRLYRGRVRLVAAGDRTTFRCVNVVPLEDYIASVIDSEMPLAFPKEARAAQAIVARTYAVSQKQAAPAAAEFDTFATVRGQKYLGMKYRDGSGRLLAGESESSRRIAAETAGQVCLHRGKIFCTYYSAVCGGRTLRGGTIFSDAAPPLKSVVCSWCRDAERFSWTVAASKETLFEEVQAWLKSAGRSVGSIRDIQPGRQVPAGELPVFVVRGSSGSTELNGHELRGIWSGHGVQSPRFTLAAKGSDLNLRGTGHGHGVGFCQWGARGMAGAGRRREAIVQHYFPETTIGSLEKLGER
jgi:stage II sporulation protein D